MGESWISLPKCAWYLRQAAALERFNQGNGDDGDDLRKQGHPPHIANQGRRAHRWLVLVDIPVGQAPGQEPGEQAGDVSDGKASIFFLSIVPACPLRHKSFAEGQKQDNQRDRPLIGYQQEIHHGVSGGGETC